jgi:hypothetical protein
LALTSQRPLLVGVGSASLVAVGANFGGITSFLLGSSLPQSGRTLALLYQLEGITDGSKKMKDLFGRFCYMNLSLKFFSLT